MGRGRAIARIRPAPRELDELLPETLRNAVRAPFYRRRFGQTWRRIRTPADLARLPVLDKATAIRHQAELVVGERPAGFGIASSGTTRAEADIPPLNVLCSAEEAEAILRDAPPERPTQGWTVVVTAVAHGLPGGPAPGELLVPWMHDRNALYMLEAVLEQVASERRGVTALRISVGALKVFTVWQLERGKDPRRFGVKLIGTNSFHLGPSWRERIAEWYGARLFDNYSLSEFATPATECAACGWLHFGWPPVLHEVVDLVSGRPLTEGHGRLLLTGLFPYVQKMPFIRYDTGDVVELGPYCEWERAPGLRFLGRARRGLVLDEGGRGGFVLSPCAVQDVLEELPGAHRALHPCATLGIVRSVDIGLPRWTVELARGAPPTAVLRFEVRFDPLVLTEQARGLEAEVREALLRMDPPLRERVRKRRLELCAHAVRAETLKPPPDKYE